jgi:hypothetical protein
LTNPPDLVRIARDKSELVVVRRGDEAGSFVYGAAAGKKAAAKPQNGGARPWCGTKPAQGATTRQFWTY